MKLKILITLFLLSFFSYISIARIAGRSIIFKSKNEVGQLTDNKSTKFLENKGQMTDMTGNPVPFVLFKVETIGVNFYITEKGLTYCFFEIEADTLKESYQSIIKNIPKNRESEGKKLKWSRIDMDLKDANIKIQNIIKEGKSASFNQYFLSHCPKGIAKVHSYSKVTIKEVYPGIDWVFYNSNNEGLKYDFVIHESANPDVIKLLYRSKEKIEMDLKGNLRIETPYGKLTENAPFSYIEETKEKIASQYIKKTIVEKNSGYETEINFQVNKGDLNFSNKTIVIDPQLIWGTYFGGNESDNLLSVKLDANGNTFVCGYSSSTNFPLLNASGNSYFQSEGEYLAYGDANIAKFDDEQVLIWSTYYGGTMTEGSFSLTADSMGNVFLTGYTNSIDFPLLNPEEGAYFQNINAGSYDLFIVKFDNNGVLLWSTYYGGNEEDLGHSITTDNFGNIFVTGYTGSIDFPTLDIGGDAYYQEELLGNYNAIVIKFNNTGILMWATLYGGSSAEWWSHITTDIFGNIFISGFTTSPDFPTLDAGDGAYFQNTLNGESDIYIVKFSIEGTLQWATYFGGEGSEWERWSAIETDSIGNLFITGTTQSMNLPLLNPGGETYFQDEIFDDYPEDIFILKFSSNGILLWSTYFGGTGSDWGNAICIDDYGNLFVTGQTISSDFPLLDLGNSSFFYENTQGYYDSYLLKFNNNGKLLWSTYSGSMGNDYGAGLDVDYSGRLVAVGSWGGEESNGILSSNSSCYYVPEFQGYYSDGFIMQFYSLISANFNSSNVNCNGQCTGFASVEPTGGLAPYSYSWNTDPVQTTQTIAGLCSGLYTVTITDARGSTSEDSIIILEPDTLTILTTTVPLVCFENATGFATAFPLGGTEPYQYLWNTSLPQTTQTASELENGFYSVIVTDQNGCQAVQLVSITQPPPIEIDLSIANATCGNSNGSVVIGAIGGSGELICSWNSFNQNTLYLENLVEGLYTFTITDTNECSLIDSLTILQLPNPTAIVSVDNNTISNNASAQLYANNFVSYNWSPNLYLSCNTCQNPIASPKESTEYCVLVSDTNGCSDSACVIINVCNNLFVPNVFSPNNDGQNDYFSISEIKDICVDKFSISIYNRWGQLIFESDEIDFKWFGKDQKQNELNDGLYYIIISGIIAGENLNTQHTVTLLK